MTSTLVIAEGTDNDHASVIKLVRTYLADLREFGLLDFKSESSGGRPTEFAVLNEPQATLVMTYMRNSDIVRGFKKRLVRAFFEMAQRAIDPTQLLNDPAAMRGLLMSYAEKALALESAVAEQAPKIEAFDRIADAEGSLCIRDAAKALQVRPSDLKAWLLGQRWIYVRPGHAGWLAYQERIQQGVLTHKVNTYLGRDGEQRISEQVKITPKGLARIAERLRRVA